MFLQLIQQMVPRNTTDVKRVDCWLHAPLHLLRNTRQKYGDGLSSDKSLERIRSMYLTSQIDEGG